MAPTDADRPRYVSEAIRMLGPNAAIALAWKKRN